MTKKNIALNITEDLMRIVVIILMTICLFNMPVVYYRVIRFVVCAIFAYFSIRHFRAQNGCLGYICAAATLTFEPVCHLSLGWVIWDIIDIIVIIVMVYMGVRAFKEHHTKKHIKFQQ